MGSLTEDLWEMILVRLSVRSITRYKLVCKQWKSIVESPFFRELFVSRHQNSNTSWSAICKYSRKEVVAYYGCEIWGLSRSLGSYISSFLTENFKTQKRKVRVLAYTDVGLILMGLKTKSKNPTSYFVANPISRQCVKIPPWPFLHLGIQEESQRPGLVTRIEKDVLLGYKVVFMDTSNITTGVLSLLVYSSETGKWSFNILQYQPYLNYMFNVDPTSLNGNIYWIGYYSDYNNLDHSCEVLVSHDLYAESDRCRVIFFPHVGMNQPFRKRSCTISQEFLMYTNIVYDYGKGEYKLCAWRLKSWEWHLVSEIFLEHHRPSFDYLPLAINPFDCNTVYIWSKMHGRLASTNLYKRQLRLHNNLERSSDRGTLSFPVKIDTLNDLRFIPLIPRFVLPRWLYRIPSSPS